MDQISSDVFKKKKPRKDSTEEIEDFENPSSLGAGKKRISRKKKHEMLKNNSSEFE